jgi:hypothetical protein
MSIKKLVAVFAEQQKPKGRAGNVYFDGRVLYSYGAHFPMAYIRGGRAFLNVQKYSVSTSRQQGYTHAALAHAGYEITQTDTAGIKAIIAEESGR